MRAWHSTLLIASGGLLSNCSGHVIVHHRGCTGNAQWAIDRIDYRPNFAITRSLSSTWGAPTTAYLSQILEQNDMDCAELRQVKVGVGRTWRDVLASAIPFYGRHTITVEGISDAPTAASEQENGEEEEDEDDEEEDF